MEQMKGAVCFAVKDIGLVSVVFVAFITSQICVPHARIKDDLLPY